MAASWVLDREDSQAGRFPRTKIFQLRMLSIALTKAPLPAGTGGQDGLHVACGGGPVVGGWLAAGARPGRGRPLPPDQSVHPRVRHLAVDDAVFPQRPFTPEAE